MMTCPIRKVINSTQTERREWPLRDVLMKRRTPPLLRPVDVDSTLFNECVGNPDQTTEDNSGHVVPQPVLSSDRSTANPGTIRQLKSPPQPARRTVSSPLAKTSQIVHHQGNDNSQEAEWS